MEIDPRRLRFLLAIARNGGILAAADELQVTPSAVSQQLVRLERETGVTLVRRTPRGAVLTDAGRTVADAAEEIERTLNVARARLSQDESGPTGTVRVGAFHSFLNAVLIRQLPIWRQRYPELRFDLCESPQDDHLRRLRAGELDIVIVEVDGESRPPALPTHTVEWPLLDEPWKLVTPAGLLAGADPIELGRLALPWLGTETSGAVARAVGRVRQSLGLTDATVHTFQDTATALSFVAAGEGVTILPSLALVDVDLTGIDALDVPGLGTRRVALRRHVRRDVPAAVEAAATLIRESAASVTFS